MDLTQHQGVTDILAQLADSDRPIIGVDGTWGSFTPLLVAHLHQTTSLPILYIRYHIDDADKASDDLYTFGIKDVDALPAWEGEEDYADATDEVRTARLGVALKMLSHSMSLVCAPIQALSQPAPKGAAILEGALRLQVDQTVDPEQVGEWLVDSGFETVDSATPM